MRGTQLTIIGLIAGLVIVGVILGYATKRGGDMPPPPQSNFSQDGNLVKNNPGSKPDTWYLVYDQAGSPAASKELSFSSVPNSVEVGMRAHVEGYATDQLVEVRKIDILNAYKPDLIWVDTPRPNDIIISPITLHGWAKSSWYFEAVFPVKLLDATGKVVAQTQAHAQGDWTTGNYVEFMASLNYPAPASTNGVLVLQKDNPSGLPQNEDQLQIPVKFGTEGRAIKLYYYNPSKDKDASGNTLCSNKGLVAVDRQIPITDTPIQDTIRLLLEGKLTDQEKSVGITTEFPLAGLQLKGANVSGQTLTLEFADPQNKTSGGSCRVSVLWAQIQATAKQFPGIANVKFKPAELFQP